MKKTKNDNFMPACSICGNDDKNIRYLQIKTEDNPSFFICSECVAEMDAKLNGLKGTLSDWGGLTLEEMEQPWDASEKKDGKKTDANKSQAGNGLYPKKIKDFLDSYIVGQEEAKKILSVAYYNHLKRVSIPKDKAGIVKKANILLVGPTGSGKTLLAKKLAEVAKIPFVAADATSLTKAGYVGKDVDSILLQLIYEAGGDIKQAEKGIIYLDESDKLANRGTLDNYVGGTAVQQSLLKIMEGTKVTVTLEDGIQKQETTIDTTNILFIIGGAFSGIEKIYARRHKKALAIGFGGSDAMQEHKSVSELRKEAYQNLETEDFIEYGMIPEFMGRIPVIACLDKLEEKDLVAVLTEPKDSICNEYKYLFNIDGINLSFEEEALQYIAKQAYKKNVGARGLRSVLESIMLQVTYESRPAKTTRKKRLTITKDLVQQPTIKKS